MYLTSSAESVVPLSTCASSRVARLMYSERLIVSLLRRLSPDEQQKGRRAVPEEGLSCANTKLAHLAAIERDEAFGSNAHHDSPRRIEHSHKACLLFFVTRNQGRGKRGEEPLLRFD